jgi:spore germination protein Q
MNSGFHTNPTFPGTPSPLGTPNQQTMPGLEQQITGFPFIEISYVENILRLNRGKRAKFYMSFPDSIEWRDRVFSGIVEEAGRDHIIINDPATGAWYLLLMIYLNYVEFDEPIAYDLFFNPTTAAAPAQPTFPTQPMFQTPPAL